MLFTDSGQGSRFDENDVRSRWAAAPACAA